MPKGRDPKISLYLLIFIVDIKKVYNFGQLKNEGVKDLPESQLFALKLIINSVRTVYIIQRLREQSGYKYRALNVSNLYTIQHSQPRIIIESG